MGVLVLARHTVSVRLNDSVLRARLLHRYSCRSIPAIYGWLTGLSALGSVASIIATVSLAISALVRHRQIYLAILALVAVSIPVFFALAFRAVLSG